MALRSILAAIDATPGGRHAVRMAAALARVGGAQLVVLTVRQPSGNAVVPAGMLVSSAAQGDRGSAELGDFLQWLGEDAPSAAEMVVAFGIPSVEIARLARQRSADLIVIGRRPRARQHPLRLGDTADGLVRRSDVPVLSVPPSVERMDSALIALDGGKRSAVILEKGMALARALEVASTHVVTVEVDRVDEQAGAQPTGRTLRLERSLDYYRALAASGSSVALTVRRGTVVGEVLREVEERRPDVLVLGYRRGGPARLVAPSEIARNLLYSSPTAVLTIPL